MYERKVVVFVSAFETKETWSPASASALWRRVPSKWWKLLISFTKLLDTSWLMVRVMSPTGLEKRIVPVHLD